MRSFICLGLFGCLIALAPGLAFAADGCPIPPPADIDVEIVAPPVQFDPTKSLDQIRAMSARRDHVASGVHEVPVGLTTARFQVGSSFEVMTRGLRGAATVCAWISRFTLSIGFVDTKVYVAREIPRGSCGYRAVLEHEGKHVAVDKNLLAQWKPKLPAYIQRAVDESGPIRVASADDADKRFHDHMETYIDTLAQSIAEARERQQQRVDTPEEYRRVGALCDGQIGRAIAAAQR